MDEGVWSISALQTKAREQQTKDGSLDHPLMSPEQDPEEKPVPDNTKEVSAKTLVINVYDLVDEDINRKSTWKALRGANLLDTGYEYFRRTFKECVDGNIHGTEIENAVDEEIQAMIKPVLLQHGVAATGDVTNEAAASTDSASTQTTFSETGSSSVPLEDIQTVREQIELLHEESKALADDSIGAQRAEFIGARTLELLDELNAE